RKVKFVGFPGSKSDRLLDHALLIHPEQRACLENRAPACTVSSLKQAACAETVMRLVRNILAAGGTCTNAL
ncbi:MAG: hypothetical protein NFW16_00040, partial [Candidatus Accumulibacter sp.]|nr:hypothetical protein [Accumulibacter sp.]